MRQVVVATTNSGKASEFAEILGSVATVVIPGELPLVAEGGASLADNAFLKARSAADYLGCDAVADDSGLFVAALGGEPGVHSARFAGPDCDDASNRAKLISKLGGVSDRSAYFETVLCVCAPSREMEDAAFFYGRCDGFITDRERGDFGFGYDSIFMPVDGDGRTFGEMTAREKATMSHRARAISHLRLWLAEGSQ